MRLILALTVAALLLAPGTSKADFGSRFEFDEFDSFSYGGGGDCGVGLLASLLLQQRLGADSFAYGGGGFRGGYGGFNGGLGFSARSSFGLGFGPFLTPFQRARLNRPFLFPGRALRLERRFQRRNLLRAGAFGLIR